MTLRTRNDFGVQGMQLFELADQLCRDTANTIAKQLKINSRADPLLDPVFTLGKKVKRDSFNPATCYTAYVPPEFVYYLQDYDIALHLNLN